MRNHRYDSTGQTTTFASHSSAAGGGASTDFKKDAFLTLQDAQSNEVGYGEKPDFFSTRATVAFTKPEGISYPACPTDRCNKKVTVEAGDQWRCEKCDKTFDAPEYRYVPISPLPSLSLTSRRSQIHHLVLRIRLQLPDLALGIQRSRSPAPRTHRRRDGELEERGQ